MKATLIQNYDTRTSKNGFIVMNGMTGVREHTNMCQERMEQTVSRKTSLLFYRSFLGFEEDRQKSKKSYSLLFYTVFLTIRLGF